MIAQSSRLLTLLVAALLSATALSQTRADQVFAVNRRGANVTYSGTVVANGLDEVRIELEGDETKVDSVLVTRVVFGSAPKEFRDAGVYASRGQFEEAVNLYREVASDDDVRDVIRARARLEAARSLIGWGTKDANQFGEATQEAAKFLSDFSDNRELPEARALQARSKLLAGDAAGAAADYRALFDEGSADPPTPGYDRFDCLEAGLAGARSFLAAEDAGTAREVFDTLSRSASEYLGSLDEDDPRAARVAALVAEADLGEGWVLLADGKARQAGTFFRGRLSSINGDSGTAKRFGVEMGVGEALFAEGDHRQAQMHFAVVSALDHTDRDRVARALVRLAECSIALEDSDAAIDAVRWLEDVESRFGDTPAARQAADMLAKLR